ncbi:unnamed protein product, partial [Laminaria digitata]
AGEGGSASSTPLVEYTMMLHPPLVVENLLPHAGDFELVDQNKGLLWRAHLEPGASIGVYTVGLDTPLRLVINLDFCRSHEGVLIHDGRRGSRASLGGFNLAGGDGRDARDSARLDISDSGGGRAAGGDGV